MALSEKSKRNRQVTFWLTEGEKQDLHDLAEDLGLDVSKTIRLGLAMASRKAGDET